MAHHDGKADDLARLYLAPGMNYRSGCPATDQFDMLAPLVGGGARQGARHRDGGVESASSFSCK